MLRAGPPEPRALLIRRGHAPFQNMWAIPGGFLGMGEDLEDGARRELAEETGVRGVESVFFGVYGTPGRDPRGRTISAVYLAAVPADDERAGAATAGDDAAEAAWHPLSGLPALAFDHDCIAADLRRGLPALVVNTDLLRGLLPREFNAAEFAAAAARLGVGSEGDALAKLARGLGVLEPAGDENFCFRSAP